MATARSSATAIAAKSFNVPLQKSGYATGFVGKYMNGYEMSTNYLGKHLAPAKVAGWDSFEAILGGGYHGWGFWSTWRDRTGMMRVRHTVKPPRSAPVAKLDRRYATNVAVRTRRGLPAQASRRVEALLPRGRDLRSARPDDDRPTRTTPRSPRPSPTAPRRATRPAATAAPGAAAHSRCSDLKGYDDPRADNAPTYLKRNGTTRPAPAWNTNPVTLRPEGALTAYRDRARMVQSIDRMLGRLRAEAGPNTYFFLTSDNGFHLGQLQLNGGKGTPYDFDTHVPLVVTGPGVRAGHAQAVRQQHRPGARPSSRWPGCARRATGRGSPSRDSLRAPRARGGRFVFYDHTYAQVARGRGGQRPRGGRRHRVDPVVHRGAGQARAAGARRPGQLLARDRLRVGALSLRRAVGGPQRVRRRTTTSRGRAS